MEKLNWMIDEVAHRLEEEKQNHDVAKLVVPEECREIRVCGEEFSYGRPCFNIWGATSRCSNCSSYKAVRAISLFVAGQPSCFGPTQFQCPSGSLKGQM